MKTHPTPRRLLPCLGILAYALFVGCGDKSESESTEPEPAAYPLKVCVVSGEELGNHGDPFLHQHEGRTVKFCCEPCVDEFNEAPAQFLAKLDEAGA